MFLFFKVHIFWEGHKVKISQNLVAFSEYMNFDQSHKLLNNRKMLKVSDDFWKAEIDF